MTDAEWDRLGELIAGHMRASEARRPTACLVCGAADPIPSFAGDDFECQRCGAIVPAARRTAAGADEPAGTPLRQKE